MKRKGIMSIVAVVVIVLAGVGIYEYATTYNEATLKLSASDIPVNANISTVYITFSSVSIHGNSSGWTNYTVTSKTVNVLDVTLNNSSFLGTITIPAGKYTVIRVYISSVNVEVAGANISFRLSSHFGFLNHQFSVSAHSTSSLIFEFNLHQDLNISSKTFTPYIGVVMS